MHARKYATQSASGGFTLVELLIVVVILAVIAAIVVPQLSATTTDAKESALQSNLANLRSAVAVYRQQHGHYPGDAAASGASCPSSGTAGTGTIVNFTQRAQSFAEQMTMYSNAAGQACSTTDSTFKYGPYLKSAELGNAGIPKNSITDSKTVSVITAGDLSMSSSSTTGGWKYDTTVGKLIVDHQDYDHF